MRNEKIIKIKLKIRIKNEKNEKNIKNNKK